MKNYKVEVEDVIAYHDDLVKKKRCKTRTVSMKFSVVRTYFGYLKAAGYSEINPADTKIVSVPPPVLRQNPVHLRFQQLRFSFSQPNISRSKFDSSVEGSLITAS